MKKTILHFIFSLGRGGAETMLVRTIKELKEYNNIVVTIKDDNEFGDELTCDKYICLHLKYIALYPLAIFKLKKIIKDNQVDIVHSHLFWPTIISRLSVPKNIPLFTTIHAFIATSVEYKRWDIRFLDKLTFRAKKSTIIAVAKGAQEEYFSYLKLTPFKTKVLYTFVDMDKFSIKNHASPNGTFRVLTVGALRIQKNQQYLVRSMALLKNEDIELDIYGGGPLHDKLQSLIDETGAKVNLKGVVHNIEEVLPQYHVFTMSSLFEGFSLAVLEAMATKTPVLLSNISSFQEQGANTVLYFDIKNESSFADNLIALLNNQSEKNRLAELAYERVTQNFTLPVYMNNLRKIYQEL